MYPLLKHPFLAKEAQALIEAGRHLKHYLTGKRFTLRTDEMSVTFMFGSNAHGQDKNDKILRWWMDLSFFSVDFVYILVWIIFRQAFYLVSHVPYRMTNLFDSYTMR